MPFRSLTYKAQGRLCWWVIDTTASVIWNENHVELHCIQQAQCLQFVFFQIFSAASVIQGYAAMAVISVVSSSRITYNIQAMDKQLVYAVSFVLTST